MDFSISRILNKLQKGGVLDDTLIWFTTDNGGWLGNGADNSPLRDGKLSVYEGGVRGVSFVFGPGIASGICNQVTHAVDAFPTILAMAGVHHGIDVDGQDISGFLRSQGIIEDRQIIHLLHRNQDNFVGCIRIGPWKYHRFKIEELYNVDSDPGEQDNVIQEYPDVVLRLVNELKSYLGEWIQDPPTEFSQPTGPPPGYVMPKYWGKDTVKFI